MHKKVPALQAPLSYEVGDYAVIERSQWVGKTSTVSVVLRRVEKVTPKRLLVGRSWYDRFTGRAVLSGEFPLSYKATPEQIAAYNAAEEAKCVERIRINRERDAFDEKCKRLADLFPSTFNVRVATDEYSKNLQVTFHGMSEIKIKLIASALRSDAERQVDHAQDQIPGN